MTPAPKDDSCGTKGVIEGASGGDFECSLSP